MFEAHSLVVFESYRMVKRFENYVKVNGTFAFVFHNLNINCKIFFLLSCILTFKYFSLEKEKHFNNCAF